jgi:hypothetical protein
MTGFRIASLTAYTTIGADDEEGVIGFLSPEGTWVPLVAADETRLDGLRDKAQLVADLTGYEVRVRRFEHVVEVETLRPR